MALQQVLWRVAVAVLVFSQGCHSQEQQPACGVSTLSSRIVGGQNVIPGSYPWHVALNISGNVSCGGSLITDQWVLTAAHCIKFSELDTTLVHLGLQNVTGPNPNEVIRTLARVVCHPAYNPVSYDNDICLLRLLAPVNFSNYTRPVCLASAGSTFYNGTSSWVAGFGSTESFGPTVNTLQEVNVPIIGQRQCQCFHRSNITRNMICAGSLAGGKDSCQGDSGGAMVSRNGSVHVQSGIVSWGVGCGQPRSPGVYTRVSRYQQWINDTVTGMRPGFVTFTSWGDNSSDLNFTCPTPPPHFSTHRPPNTTHYPPWFSTLFPPWFTTYPPRPGTPCQSLFCAGENLMHFTHFVALSAVALVLHVLVGSG